MPECALQDTTALIQLLRLNVNVELIVMYPVLLPRVLAQTVQLGTTVQSRLPQACNLQCDADLGTTVQKVHKTTGRIHALQELTTLRLEQLHRTSASLAQLELTVRVERKSRAILVQLGITVLLGLTASVWYLSRAALLKLRNHVLQELILDIEKDCIMLVNATLVLRDTTAKLEV